ncbi:MAG: STAS domain-containing protein [Methanospirillum sp.]|nr:STAS domain-containing protein [Methanospirillum sp.]
MSNGMNNNEKSVGEQVSYLLRDELGNCMPIDIWYDGDIWVFRPLGRIDAGHSVDLDTALTEGIDQGMRLIVLDLTDVPYISSSGLRTVIKAAKAVKSDGGRITICGLNDTVREIFKVSGLFNIFREFPTANEAISGIQSNT